MTDGTMAASAPASAEELRAAILQRYESLSKRLQQIARYVLDEPNEMALETLAVIAERCGVQPSAIIRFAKTFGYPGASQMQRLFRAGLLSGHAGLSHGERARHLDETETKTGAAMLADFVEGATLALQNLGQTISEADMAKAVSLIDKAEMVYVAGFRYSFPVASYLASSLQQAHKRALLIDGVAGLTRQQVQTIGSEDLLIAVSYHPYTDDAIVAVELAAQRGARILAISDSLVSPIARSAELVLHARESEVRTFRSLAASICLAQALAAGFAGRRGKTG